MAEHDNHAWQRYLRAVAGSGGIDGLIGALEGLAPRSRGGLESASAPTPAPVPAAVAALKAVALNREPTVPDRIGLEAIIDEVMRPPIDIVDGRFVSTHPMWAHLQSDDVLRKRIESVIPAVGRIELPGHPRLPYGGTGFVVGAGLLMTNRHVAEVFARGVGERRLEFRPGLRAGIDFTRERGRPAGVALEVRRVVMIHPYWDMALLSVDGLAPGHACVRLSLEDARELPGQAIFVIGYPAFDMRNPTDVQQGLFDGVFGVKRLQPGLLHGAIDVDSFGKVVAAVAHDCSTLGGNSGSAVFDLRNGQVLGLHFGGAYHRMNHAVPAVALARDARVVAAGVEFAGRAPGGPNDWAPWWAHADEGEAAEPPPAAPNPATSGGSSIPPAPPPAGAATVLINGPGSVSFEIPLRITVSLGAAPALPPPAGGEALTEALVEPFHEQNYGNRRGYDADFLDPAHRRPAWRVPMPQPLDSSLVATLIDGSSVAHYQNFSLQMHRRRALALLTACNVSREPALRRPDPAQSYSRKALSGLGDKDQERWFADPRYAAGQQLPDVFFTRDRQAFDKGHLVRRDDVAWGATYDELRRANGDTYHVTNCSPQVADFNRSNLGELNWGDLENLVFEQAGSERLCVFAGPLLTPEDEVFVGTAGAGVRLRVKVPSRYWKMVFARTATGLLGFGFVMEQDLSAVQWEFAVPESFVPLLCPLAEVAQAAGLRLAPSLLEADGFTGEGAVRLRTRGLAPRRPRG